MKSNRSSEGLPTFVCTHDSSNTLIRARFKLTEVDGVRREGKRLASDSEADIGGNFVTWDGEEALAHGVRRTLRTRDSCKDVPSARRVDNEESGASVDDGVLSTSDDAGVAYGHALSRDLPERRWVGNDEWCEGEAAGECGGVGAAEEQLAAIIE